MPWRLGEGQNNAAYSKDWQEIVIYNMATLSLA